MHIGIGRKRRRFGLTLAAAGVVSLLCGSALAQDGVKVGDFPSESLQIIIPANPGGGWDGTARAIQGVLRDTGIAAEPVDVVNVPGGGGTVGLAQLIGQHDGNGHTAMVMGLTLVGATNLNNSPVRLTQTTPLARLTAEYHAVVVAEASEYKTLQDLADAFKANPTSVVWGGGPGGGPDHTTVGLMAEKLGIAPTDIRYSAFSGGEGRAMIMGNQVSAAVLGLSEVLADSEAGLVRILGISAPERLPGVDLPTLREQGIDLEFSNWRGIVGPPNMSDDARTAWIEMLTALNESEEWQKVLSDNNWTGAFLSGEEFPAFIKAEDERIAALFKSLGLIN